MGIWSSLRRFSANAGRQPPERSRRNRARRAKSPKARNLRVEQFEHRLLLSINPLGGDFNGILYDVDLITGTATNPRDTGLGDTAGLAIDQTGVVYALTANSAADPNALYRVDPVTGTSTKVGNTGLTVTEGELDFDPTTGLLYGVQDTTSGLQLFRVNPTTGAGTIVGQLVSTVSGQDFSAMAFDGTGRCYVLDTGNDEVSEVDKWTAAILSTSALTVDLGGAAGMAFSPETGMLYVADGSDGTNAGTNTLYSLFPGSGSLAPIGWTGLTDGLSELEFWPEWDFGDAPAGFPTLLVDNGARHLVLPNFRLGTTNDGELDGQPSGTALGDDLNGLDDEDGVVFSSSITAGLPVNVTVSASVAGRLDGWVDFDGSGSWEPGEQVFASEPLLPGPNNLSFQAPPGAATGNTFARFRFSSVGGLSPTGPAPDGEVEDHMVIVVRTLSPNLVAIIPNVGEEITEGAELYVAPRELLFRFNEGQSIDPTSLDGIQIVRSVDGTFDDGNDAVVEYGWIGLADQPHEVIVRFAETLPDDSYRITVVGSGLAPLRNIAGEPFNNGVDEVIHFELNLGAQVVAVVPQPVSRQGSVLQQDRDVIEVYFNDDPLDQAAAEKEELYQLIATQGTVEPADDGPPIHPSSAVYDPAANKVTLTFDNVDHDLTHYGTGAFRLRIGNEYHEVATSYASPGEAGSSFSAALGVPDFGGVLTDAHSLIISAAIDNTSEWLPTALEWPGANDEPGHRDLPGDPGSDWDIAGENHLSARDNSTAIRTRAYNFAPTLPKGLPNLITEAQKERAREIFEIYGAYLGIQFYETASSGIQVATGDLYALDYVSEPGGVAGLGGGNIALMDKAENWGTSEFGGAWFNTAIHEIGHCLGYDHAYDLEPYTTMGAGGGGDKVYPGINDLAHGLHMYRPDSVDIDMYRFELQAGGTFSAETFAERMANSSLLDSALKLYEQYDDDGTTRYRAIAQNDDYYSEDAYLQTYLPAGTYYIAVAASGNNQFDPNIEDSGVGGTTQGAYELRLSFDPWGVDPDDPDTLKDNSPDPAHLVDATDVLFDGDADGVPGGVYNFWFNVQAQADTIFIDKAAVGGSPDGSLANPYTQIDEAFLDPGLGPDHIVRIVGNGGADGDLATLDDNVAYEIGYNTWNVPLEDGRIMDVPQGVTVMIDAGALFKLRKANIDVGSSAEGVDRSGGAIQVLGTPEHMVYFTSHFDEDLGVDTEPTNPTTPSPGDWGGLVFRNDLDYDSDYPVAETEGIFLNYVNHADIRYGGGQVVVNGDRDVYTPIHMIEARPTVSFNVITNSANAAISADPNSFADTKFQSWVGAGSFTADYDRVGPDIHGNKLTARYGEPDPISGELPEQMNSINGLFVRVDTEAGQAITELEVAGRWDDTDIVHVVSESLFINGTPGGPIIDGGPGGGGAHPAPLTTDGEEFFDVELVVMDSGPVPPADVSQQIVDPMPQDVVMLNDVPTSGWTYGCSATSAGMIFGYYDRTGYPDMYTGPANGGVAPLTSLGAQCSIIATRNGFDGRVTNGHVDDYWISYLSPGPDPWEGNWPEHTWGECTADYMGTNQWKWDFDGDFVTSSNVDGATTFFLAGGATKLYDYVPRASAGQPRTALTHGLRLFAESRGYDVVENYTQRTDNRVAGGFSFADYMAEIDAGYPVMLQVTGHTMVGVGYDSDTQTVYLHDTWGNYVASMPWGGEYAGMEMFAVTVIHLAPLPTGAREARLDARLAIDPGVVVKMDGSRIETEVGAQLIAEGRPGTVEGAAGEQVVFTSLLDTRYGAGGTFSTSANTAQQPTPGDWGGLYFAPISEGSIDNAVIAYAGGETAIEGGFAFFDPVEIRQADARITNTRFENNTGAYQGDRQGRGAIRPAAISVRGAQPVIAGNTFLNNAGPVVCIDVNSLNATLTPDWGRSTGRLGSFDAYADNHGPLIRENRLDDNGINAIGIRGGTLNTEGVWDDTDIVHALFEEVVVPNYHHNGGLRLESSATESLVVKLGGSDAGFTAEGKPLEIDDRIGGTLQVVGQPGFPVVLTSINDCSIGAGLTPDGRPQYDTLNTGACDPTDVSVPYADVVVVMDESASMAFAQQFSIGMVADLDAALVAAGVGDGTTGINQFGLVGFGGSSFDTPPHELGHSHPVGPGGALFGTSAQYGVAAQTLVENGATEDGWEALQFTLDNYTFRPEAAKFVILVTNEDRDLLDPTVTYSSVLAGLTAADVALQGIVTADLRDGVGNQALAIDADGNAFLADGSGGYTINPGGNVSYASGTTEADYIDMVFATGGLVGDIWQIQAGGPTATSFSNALVSSIVAQAGGINPAEAGDWRGIVLDEYSHDRNVAVITEGEVAFGAAEDVNAEPHTAQAIGDLAGFEKAGDDNLRLGFEIHGTIRYDDPGDVDVYSFHAPAGTEIWLDIDRTTHALDTVLELVNANGDVLARSDDSFFEGGGDPDGSTLLGKSMDRDFWVRHDYYSTNPRDAGMRLTLPGPAGVHTYYVRVFSKDLGAYVPGDGITSGTYRLQLRLGEMQEVPGSVIKYADIRYATNGIEVRGLPGHSPLLGETVEITPDTSNQTADRTSAQNVGNLLAVDRNTISIAGKLESDSDVDWYRFTVDYQGIQSIPGINDAGSAWPVVFDLDYAAGMARPDMSIWVFDSQGRLILGGRDSNVADDRADTLEDLDAGSLGPADPFIGSAYLLEQGTYYVAVSSAFAAPDVLDPTDDANLALRLEPINSIKRKVEEHVDSGPDSFVAVDNLPDGNTRLTLYPDEFHLGDVVMYINTSDDLFTVDPFTGALETDVTGSTGSAANTHLPDTQSGPRLFYDDIAMRNDGKLFTMTSDNRDSTSGLYRRLNTGDASQLISDQSSGILTYEVDDQGDADPTNDAVVALNDGIGFTAFAHDDSNSNRYVYAVAQIPDYETGVLGLPAYTTNVLFVLDDDGTGMQPPGVSGSGPRVATNYIPRGMLTDAYGLVTGMAYVGSQLYAVTDGGYLCTITNENQWGFDAKSRTNPNMAYYEYNGGGAQLNPIAYVGPAFTGLAAGPPHAENGLYANILFATDNNTLYALDLTGALQPLFVDGQSALSLPRSGVRGVDFSPIDFNLWHQTNRRGAQSDAGHGIERTWDLSRTGDDNYRKRGRTSYYFGLDDSSDTPGSPTQDGVANDFEAGPNNNSGALGTYDMPGGAYGSLTSEPFSLEGYSRYDMPTVYFNYLAHTENNTNYDGARVYISTDGADWTLLATNTDLDDGNPNDGSWDLADRVERPAEPYTYVKEIFDTQQWRQARINLSNWAGQPNLRLRFDFSTASDMEVGNPDFTGTYLTSLPAWELIDGQYFEIGGDRFEFDLGYALVAPNAAGGAIADGEWFEVEDGDGDRVRFEFENPDDPGYVPGISGDVPVAISAGLSSFDVANQVRIEVNWARNNLNLDVFPRRKSPENRERVFLNGAVDVTQGGPTTPAMFLQADVTGGGTPVPLAWNMDAAQVAQVITDVVNAHFDQSGGPNPYQTTIKLDQSIGNLMHVIGHDVASAWPLGSGSSLEEDAPTRKSTNNYQHAEDLSGNRFTNFRRGQDNNYEGFYIDDIIIGFAERGEMVVNSPVVTGFDVASRVLNTPTVPTEGEYQLEIRRGEDYGQRLSPDALSNKLELIQSLQIDTNQRLAEQITIVAPAPGEIAHGDTFTISGKVSGQTFVFLRTGVPGGPPSSHPIYVSDSFDPDDAAAIAGLIAQAINSDAVLDVTATVVSSSDRVDLFGATEVQWTPGQGLADQEVANRLGDRNAKREKGQLVIECNSITYSSEYGIVVASARDSSANWPLPGSPRNLNVSGDPPNNLVPGIMIENNVLAFGGDGGVGPACGRRPFRPHRQQHDLRHQRRTRRHGYPGRQ